MAFAPQQQQSLASWTTLGLGGVCRWVADVRSEETLREALLWAKGRSCSVLLMGQGSNLLVSDTGFDGLVIRLSMCGSAHHMVNAGAEDARVRVTLAAGEPWDAFVAEACRRGWAGVECLSGIPGFVGASPIQNIGAYGQEVSQTITQVNVLDTKTMLNESWCNADCHFSYRHSRSKDAARDRYVVLSVTFELTPHGTPKVRYAELERALSERSAVSLVDVREAVIDLRRKKGMVLDASDPQSRSAGSFFTNPIVDRQHAQSLLNAHPNMPCFDIETKAEGARSKLAAGWLIEQAGFEKGMRHGGVAISSKHALALVNLDSGTSAELLELATRVRDGVFENFGVELVPEPRLVGCRLPSLPPLLSHRGVLRRKDAP